MRLILETLRYLSIMYFVLYGIVAVCVHCTSMQCQKLGKIFTGPTYKLLLSFMVISDIYWSFIPNKLHLRSSVLLSEFQNSPGALKSTE